MVVLELQPSTRKDPGMSTNLCFSQNSTDSIQDEAILVSFAQRQRRLQLRLFSKFALAGGIAATAATA